MIKERPPCEGGLPPTQTCTLSEGVNGSGHRASAVTASTRTIEPPHNVHHLQGSNGRTDPLKDTRLAWLAENLRRRDVSPLARCVLGWLITAAQWREDRLIIIGKGEIAERMGIGKRTADRCILELLASGCLKLVSRGGSLRGQKRDANTYALGTAFEGTPPVLRPKFKGTSSRPVSPVALVPQVRPVSSVAADQCQELHPLPIVPPNTHTHIKELSLAFNKENWLKECLKLNPSRDLKDIERTFPLALRKGAKDGDWMYLVEHFDSFYTPRSTPAVRSPAAIARKVFTLARPAPRSQCESEPSWRTPARSKFLSEGEWMDAGRPDSWQSWLEQGCPTRNYPSPSSPTKLLEAAIIKAWNRGETLTPEQAKAQGIGYSFRGSDWEIAEARAKHSQGRQDALKSL